jgi:hypothetical protein
MIQQATNVQTVMHVQQALHYKATNVYHQQQQAINVHQVIQLQEQDREHVQYRQAARCVIILLV